MYKTLVPAYGRDYKSAKEVKAAWEAGKDFLIADLFDPYDGKPANLQSVQEAGWKTVNIRFSKLTKIASIKVK
jgi:hypothetical protein